MTLYNQHILYNHPILYNGSAVIAITLTETIGLFESLLANSTMNITHTENITLTELLATAQSLVANLTEMLALTENMTTASTMIATMQESLTVLDQLYTGLEITLQENITATENLNYNVGYAVAIQEIVSLLEQLNTNIGYSITTTENLHMLDMLKKAVDGICDRWTDRVEPTTTWTDRTRTTTTWTDRVNPGECNLIPIVDFHADKTLVAPGEYFILFDDSLNQPTSWERYDSNTPPNGRIYLGNTKNLVHGFAGVGTYSFKLIARNKQGEGIMEKIGYVVCAVAAPVANFYADNLTPTVNDVVTFMDTSTNTPTSWLWEYKYNSVWNVFDTVQNPTVIFPAGLISVRLTATNAGGSDTETKIDYINVIGPDFSADITSGDTPLLVTFTTTNLVTPTFLVRFFGDTIANNWIGNAILGTTFLIGDIVFSGASYYVCTVGYTYTLGDPTPDNDPTHWLATYPGDGRDAGNDPQQYTYNNPGTYTVKMGYKLGFPLDPTRVTKIDYITVTSSGVPPVASGTVLPTVVNIMEDIYLTDTSTGSPTSWMWQYSTDSGANWFDGYPTQNAVDVWGAVGFYSYKLIVSNAYGTDSVEFIDVVEVIDTNPPTSRFSITPLSANRPYLLQNIQLNDGSSGSPTSWARSDNHGRTSVLQNPTYAVLYDDAIISLTATNIYGVGDTYAYPMRIFTNTADVPAGVYPPGTAITITSIKGPNCPLGYTTEVRAFDIIGGTQPRFPSGTVFTPPVGSYYLQARMKSTGGTELNRENMWIVNIV